MKPLTNKSTVLTGIFVTAGIVILLATVLFIGGKDSVFTKSISVTAVFDDVNGLAKGNSVWFEGVKIGTVKGIVFVGKGVDVSFVIENSALPHIYMDTKAKLGSDGLIGNKIIVLYGGSSATSTVKAGHVFEVEKASSTEEIMNTLQASNKNLLEITGNFKDLSAVIASGKGNIGKLLKNDSLINTLQATMSILQKSALNSQLLTANLAGFSDKLTRKGSSINELITDTSFFASLKATSTQLQTATFTANKIANNLNATTQSLNDNNGPVGTMLHDTATANHIKATMVNLQSSTHKLDETMEALQHNFLVRGFFKKKEKAAEKNKVQP